MMRKCQLSAIEAEEIIVDSEADEIGVEELAAEVDKTKINPKPTQNLTLEEQDMLQILLGIVVKPIGNSLRKLGSVNLQRLVH